MKILISFIFIWLITPNAVFAHCGKCGIGDKTDHKKDHHEECSYVKDGKKVNCSAKDHSNCPLCKAGDHANCPYCNKKNKKDESSTQKKSTTQNTPTTKNAAPTKK